MTARVGGRLHSDIEERPGVGRSGYRACVRWYDTDGKRRSTSETFPDERAASEWIEDLSAASARGGDPAQYPQTLATYGPGVLPLALRGLEPKTMDLYLAGWRLRVLPALGHLTIPTITCGAVDRAMHGWIADECSRSTVKNSLAVLVRIMEQAARDGPIDRNPARITGWQREVRRVEDELDDPGRWPCRAGRSCGGWRRRSSPGRPATSPAGARSSHSPP